MVTKRCAMKIFSILVLTFAFPLLAHAQLECGSPCVAFGTITSSPASTDVEYYNNSANQWTLAYTSSSGAFSAGFPEVMNPYQYIEISVTFAPNTSTFGSYSGTPYAEYEYEGQTMYIYISATGAYAIQIFVNPKYIIMGVEYSPPGTSSTVTYSENTVVGSSTSVTNSFSKETMSTFSVSVSAGQIPGFKTSETATTSDSYTEEVSNALSVAISQTTSASTGLKGQTVALNHDWDYIFVWLNPIARYTVGPSSTQVQWNGYGYDLNDTGAYPDMEVIGIPLGCLDGDFSWSSSQCVNIPPRLARTWALNNVDGTGPGLTSADLTNIEHADPFYTTYTLKFASGSNTTTDGRFTACSNSGCSTTIDYEQGVNQTYSQGYSTTTTLSETATNIYSTTFSLESQFQGGTAAASFTEDLGNSTTLTWTTVFSQSTNSSDGQTAAFSIVGPGSGYTGPPEFVVYQDNLYGTFMFYPVD
jgi:trimeric autotransporter adhesin